MATDVTHDPGCVIENISEIIGDLRGAQGDFRAEAVWARRLLSPARHTDWLCYHKRGRMQRRIDNRSIQRDLHSTLRFCLRPRALRMPGTPGALWTTPWTPYQKPKSGGLIRVNWETYQPPCV